MQQIGPQPATRPFQLLRGIKRPALQRRRKAIRQSIQPPAIIGQMAGGTLMVLKAGEHPMREIELAVKRLQQANVNLRGILFNDIRTQSRSYGVGKYNYQYTYKKA